MFLSQGYKAFKPEGITEPLRAGPGECSGDFSVFQIQDTQVICDCTMVHGEAFAVQCQLNPGQVRKVGQLTDFLFVKTIECTGNQQVTGLPDILFFKSSTLAEISVSLTENGFTFSLMLNIKISFSNQPVFLISGS